MKSLLKKSYFVSLLVAFFILAPLTIVHASDLTAEVTDIEVNKPWTITFNLPVVESSVNANSIYVLNSKNEKQVVTSTVKDQVVTIHAPKDGYKYGQSYTLHVTTDVLGQSGKDIKSLTQSITKPFTAEKAYVVVTIQKDGTSVPVANFNTFNEANASLQDHQGIMLNDKYVKIPTGFVATNTKAVTLIYKEEDFKNEYTGVTTDTELVYVDATENYVKVKAFGQDMYVKQEDVTLIPTAAAKGQSYYLADEEGLWHHIYHHHRNKKDGAYLIGKKPDFLKKGVKYFSTDGVTFTDESGKIVGKGLAYFQYLSPRVPTSYSASQLDAYITSQLTEKEGSGLAKYANASTKSTIIGLGTTLKTIEKDHRINALFILSLAIHESDFGMSCHAQNYNNLFGLNVTDTNDTCSTNVDTTSSKYYPSIEANIKALVKKLNTNFLNPLSMQDYRYNGLALGNKLIGMNVRYASDPYWGAKIAGHLYRIDQALGSKDYKKYAIGFTTQKYVSVRTGPVIKNGDNTNRAYQYLPVSAIKQLERMPITLSNTPSETTGWYRIISELPNGTTDLYTSIDNVRIETTY